MKRPNLRIFLVLCVLASAALLGACTSDPSVKPAANTNTQTNRTVADDLGRPVTVPAKIMRIVSLAPNLTEMIFAVGAGDRLVGVTTFCNFPEQANSIAKIGDTMTPNMESIVALRPDVVFVSTASQIETFTKTLSDNGIAVYVTNPITIEDVLKNLKQLGELFRTEPVADALVSDLKQRINRVSDRVGLDERTRVFVQISREPLFTIGKESFLNAVLVKAGGVSVTADVETAFPKLSKETALALRPDVIILSESDDNLEPNEVFRNSPAVKNGRVYMVNADILSRPGPRLVDAIEQIAAELHPETLRNK
ncbi:MAG: cobalamin-binding protein [Pyrinomonadaceae bacterium]